MPELIAASELYAYPGRGGVLMFELDENGNRTPEEAKPVDEATKTRRVQKAGRGGRAAKTEEERKREYEEQQKKARRPLLARKGAPRRPRRKGRPRPRAAAALKETTKGVRWVVLTGILDHKKLRENYLNALKRPEIAHPHFKQLEVERQTATRRLVVRWEAVDADENLKYPRQPARGGRGVDPGRVRSKRWSTPCPSSRRAPGSTSTSPAWCPRRRRRFRSRSRTNACDARDVARA